MISIIEDKNELGNVIGILIYNDNDRVRDFSNIENFIKWLFRYRCVGLDDPCHKQASDISHIETGHDNSDWRKIVLHCRECHNEYHRRGVSDEAIGKLTERRAEYLEVIGRFEYI